MISTRKLLQGCTVAAIAGVLALSCGKEQQLSHPVAPEGFTPSGPVVPASHDGGPDSCMGNDAVAFGGVSGFGSNPNAFNCTANDISIANAAPASGVAIQCVQGDSITVDIVADIVQTAASTRHDIGIWIAEGGGTNAEDGECAFFNLDNFTEPGVTDEDGDACGDMVSAAVVDSFPLSALDLVCDDPDDDGFLLVGSCVSWTQPGGDEVCPDTTSGGVDLNDETRAGTLPANKSKCNCDPFLVPVEILGELTLEKIVVNNDGGTAVDTDWSLRFVGPDSSGVGVEGDASITNAPVPAATYTLSEEDGPANYTADAAWVCTGDGTFTSPNLIELESGDSATCRITNRDDPLSLTLTKLVINNDGGTAVDTDWSLRFKGPDNGVGVEGDGSITNVAVDAGTYTLSEEDGPTGYMSNGVWNCTGQGTFTSPNLIALGLGDTASCEITNTDDPISLTLTKKVTNNDGGTAVDTDWSLRFKGPDNGVGVEGDGPITNAMVDAGTYTLSEEDGPANYSTTGVWNCTGDGTFTSPNKIALALGDTASCEITNTDDPLSLTLTKTVVNNDGGTAVETDWSLRFKGPDNGVGVEGDGSITAVAVDAGMYTLSEEDGPSGYSSTGVWSCTGDGTFTSPNKITLGLGDTASCDITNTDDPLSLTLEKIVVNNDGGTAVDTDWSLRFKGPDNGVGVEGDGSITNVAVDAGTYTLSEEDGPSGYTADAAWVCTGDGTFTSPNKIALGLGDTATCRITNRDDPLSLTLEKIVDNSAGGTAVDTDWSLRFKGPDNGVGVEGDAPITNAAVDAGTYTLSEEDGPPFYTTTGVWVCTGDGSFTSPDKITLGLGDTATCRITNVADPPACEAGDRLTSVTLEVIAVNPSPLLIEWTDDTGNLNSAGFTAVDGSPSTVGEVFTIVPDDTFFDSQNLRFRLDGEPSKNLKVHLSCSDDPAIGDQHFGTANGASATLEKTNFTPTPFNP